MALNEGGDGEDRRMGDVIRVTFGEGRQISRSDRFAEAARRSEAEALRQTDEIADVLKRCAARYRAAEGGS